MYNKNCKKKAIKKPKGGNKKMQVREPIYIVGEKVIDKKGALGTIYSVYSYNFDKDEFFFSVEENGNIKVKSEINLYKIGDDDQ